MLANSQTDQDQATRLLLSVAEQLKIPLTQIARQTELVMMLEDTDQSTKNMHAQATAALILVDSYLLGLELFSTQQTLLLEPVSISSILADTAHSLDSYAKQYHVEIEVELAGRYGPVMAHAAGLRAAMLSLGYSLIEARATQEVTGPKRVTLAAHRSGHGIITGMYGNAGLDSVALRKAQKLYGQAQQPLATVLGGSGAGIFVADVLAQAMESQLRVGRYARQVGLAMTLLPSQQLQFV